MTRKKIDVKRMIRSRESKDRQCNDYQKDENTNKRPHKATQQYKVWLAIPPVNTVD